MEQLINVIPLSYTSEEINSLLASAEAETHDVPFYFTDNEDLFLKLEEAYSVPSFPIHHDIRNQAPHSGYIEKLSVVLKSLLSLIPGIFLELSYFFDPSEVFKPCFYQIFSLKGEKFLYLLRLDLSFRPGEHRTLQAGGNDFTPVYQTDKLFLESEIIPLENVMLKENRITGFVIKQLVQKTWVGESGRGYFVQGIWIDRALTKFFSRLFTPCGVRTYPYYPFSCKYRTVCLSLLDISPRGKRKYVPYLKYALQLLEPAIPRIEKVLKSRDFSEDLPAFRKLQAGVPSRLQSVWGEYSSEAYINEQNQKEFRIDFQRS